MMRAVFIALSLPLMVLAGCSAWRCCADWEELDFPSGTFFIEQADDPFIEAGTASFADDFVVFNYTDPNGNEWEISYAFLPE
jgi:hypothetical protein